MVCDLGTMEPGATTTIYLTVTVAASLPSTAVLQNTASVSSATPDPDPSDNTVNQSTDVDTAADVWIDKTGELRTGGPSPVVVYTLTVHNDTGCESDAQSTPTPNCARPRLAE